VICNEEDVDSRARVTADEERVLHVDWTEINLCKIVGIAAGIKTLYVSARSLYSMHSLILSQ